MSGACCVLGFCFVVLKSESLMKTLTKTHPFNSFLMNILVQVIRCGLSGVVFV